MIPRPSSPIYSRAQLLAGISPAYLDRISDILSQLLYVRSGIGTFTVTSLGYDHATLAPAFSVPGSAELHFGSRSCHISLKGLPQQGAGFFEVLHPDPIGLEVLQGIIEPVRHGERLSLRHYPPAGTHFLPAVTYSAPGPINLTYFRGGNGIDYLRLSFPRQDAFCEVLWTNRCLRTKLFPFEGPAPNNTYADPEILLAGVLTILGLRYEHVKAELSPILAAILEDALFKMERRKAIEKVA